MATVEEMATAEVMAVMAKAKETSSPEAPSAEISWRVVSYMYAVGFAVCLVLGAVQVRQCHSNVGPIDLQIG